MALIRWLLFFRTMLGDREQTRSQINPPRSCSPFCHWKSIGKIFSCWEYAYRNLLKQVVLSHICWYDRYQEWPWTSEKGSFSYFHTCWYKDLVIFIHVIFSVISSSLWNSSQYSQQVPIIPTCPFLYITKAFYYSCSCKNGCHYLWEHGVFVIQYTTEEVYTLSFSYQLLLIVPQALADCRVPSHFYDEMLMRPILFRSCVGNHIALSSEKQLVWHVRNCL